jgi:hypothetical protein
MRKGGMEGEGNWKAKAFLIGGLVGALTGMGAAYLYVRRAEQGKGRQRLTPGEGIRLGLIVLGLLRQVGQFGEGEE